ncbi:cupin domain-containing protein [Erythrobacter sp. F6033]|uniref:cupin domain-containing protein n=1 Tax=Erythrobacter sp. F6033 TaxID=2926401 RepID=UPI001FF16D03|nr:cupin domain-containing protein [Erythrobacter sp. F6033]MCK0127625.1 cupin domain-containing protein [Erythrobacter sp. F6033]
MTIRAILAASFVLALPACASDEVVAAEGAGQETRVLTTETAKATTEEWGVFKEYFAGETAATTDLLSGTATIKAGMEIHPPHRHAEEEFLMVVSGEGEWTVGEDTFTAREGDMLYAAAWDTHGIKNTGNEPLTFVFWKWNSRGLPVPVDPEL